MHVKKAAAIIVATALTLAADGLVRLNSVPEEKIIKKITPEYPPDARDARIEGVVKIAVMIGVDGHVQGVQLVSGHPLLAPAALQAAKKWVFHPFERDGKPVRALAHIQIPFSLASAQ
jgi:protein TonB